MVKVGDGMGLVFFTLTRVYLWNLIDFLIHSDFFQNTNSVKYFLKAYRHLFFFNYLI